VISKKIRISVISKKIRISVISKKRKRKKVYIKIFLFFLIGLGISAISEKGLQFSFARIFSDLPASKRGGGGDDSPSTLPSKKKWLNYCLNNQKAIG